MELFAKSIGSGEPIAILHGLLGSSDNWFTLGKRMAETFQVHLIDQRNHGRSPHSTEMSYELMADDLYAYVQKLQLERLTLIGHSMGGKTAMTFAMKYPSAVKQLISLDIAPKQYPSGAFDTIFTALSSLELGDFQSRGEIDTALSAKLPDAGLRGFLLKNVRRTEENGFAWKMNLPVLTENLNALTAAPLVLTQFPGSARFINGSKSNYITPADHSAILEHFPAADFRTVEGAGHWVHAEKPEGFMQAIADILS
ncbi:MAG: alpha/beta fold hydrolase [Calditrichia bacterium]